MFCIGMMVIAIVMMLRHNAVNWERPKVDEADIDIKITATPIQSNSAERQIKDFTMARTKPVIAPNVKLQPAQFHDHK